jgi:hypothetical protein
MQDTLFVFQISKANNPIPSLMTQNTQSNEIKSKRGRPAMSGTALSRPMSVRLTSAEIQGLQQVADGMGEAPTRLLRRAVREIISAGPDLFEDGVTELRALHRELAAVGRTLNQIARHLNAGGEVQGHIDLASASQAVKAAQDAFGGLIKCSQERWVPVVREKS